MDVQISTTKVVMYPDGRMNTSNAAAYIGLAEKTLAMLRCVGKGPKFIKRGKVFYYRTDLDEWLLAGRVSSTPQGMNKIGKA